jgi:hypothetical protein
MKSGEEIDPPAQPMATESQRGKSAGTRVHTDRCGESGSKMKRRRGGNNPIDPRLCVDLSGHLRSVLRSRTR